MPEAGVRDACFALTGEEKGEEMVDQTRAEGAFAGQGGGDAPFARADAITEAVRTAARTLEGAAADYDPLLGLVGDAPFVLLGEASHGTHEFYRERAEITKRLITEKGFTAVAVEADWPDAYRVNRYVRGATDDASSEEALAGFMRFPTWMWRNSDVLDFVGWLRDHNDAVSSEPAKVGFYGLDLYSLHAS